MNINELVTNIGDNIANFFSFGGDNEKAHEGI